VGGSGSHPESGRSKMSDSGTSRQIAAAQYFGRFWSEADIQRAALTEAASKSLGRGVSDPRNAGGAR
jgi:hypothetical protein